MATRPVPMSLVLLALVLLGAPGPWLASPAAATAAPASEDGVNASSGDASSPPPPSTTSTAHEDSSSVQTAVQRGCAARYTMTCLKLDALSVLSRMSVPASYDVLPGITIHRQEAKAPAESPVPTDLMRSLASDHPGRVDRQLDEYLMARFGSFLDSHTVQVHLLDLQPVASLRKALQSGEKDATGRRRPGGMWQQLMGAGMMMGGSTLTMGLSALAAMAGKALMLSMLSLVLSALSGMNGGGGGGGGGGGHSQKQTTYEIISKPIYTHGHSHSAELHHEPSGPAGYGLYGRAKDSGEGALAVSAGTGASGVGGSAIGGPPGSAYITQFPRSLQETSAQLSHQTKKSEEDKSSSSSSAAPANYDSLLIRNLQYVKGQDGRAKYAIASPAAAGDLVPAESDYHAGVGDEHSGLSTARKYARQSGQASHGSDDLTARSFQLSADEEDDDGLGGFEGVASGVAGLGLFESGGGVLAGPRSMHTLARIPQMLVGSHGPHQPAVYDEARWTAFREPQPSEMLSLSSPGSSWEVVTAVPLPATSTGSSVNPAFVVAKAVAPAGRVGEDEPSAASPRTVAYRAHS